MIRAAGRLSLALGVLVQLWQLHGLAQSPGYGNLPSLIDDILSHSVTSRIPPAPFSENDLVEWRSAFTLLRAQSLDSCRAILARYNYVLVEVPKATTRQILARRQPRRAIGNAYEIVRENFPIQRGWGTIIFNPNRTKRLYIHVPHPLRDENSALLGSELFRWLNAECLMIAGTDRSVGFSPHDVVRLKESMFQKWHEMLTDLVHLSLSVHGYPARAYRHPIDTTDVVVSNGRTTDEQWGISQISLSLRDTLRAFGFHCSLAMYDSGYARLTGGLNRQGRFSNDSVGFGHWLNLELSDRIRSDRQNYYKLLAAVDRGLAVTGDRISQVMNRAFGLVSPRVLHIDSQHRVLFPPPSDETYRIISFDTHRMEHDTIDIQVGNWVELRRSSTMISSISRLDSAGKDFAQQFRRKSSGAPHPVMTRIVEQLSSEHLSRTVIRDRPSDDSLSGNSDGGPIDEPFQVQRIPLEPLLTSTMTAEDNLGLSPFRWLGGATGQIFSGTPVFQHVSTAGAFEPAGGSPQLLIPVLNRSYGNGGRKFIGVQMTNLLVNQIARLVVNGPAARDIALLAEQDEKGRFFLRIFPEKAGARLSRLDRPIPLESTSIEP